MTEETVNAINKSKQAGDKVSAKANKWGIYDPPENWTDGSDIPDGRREATRGGGRADPDGVRSGESAGEHVDLEGRPLTARTIVGRTHDGSDSGPISKKALDEVAEAGTGARIKEAEESASGSSSSIGETVLDADGRLISVEVLKDLLPDIR